MELDYQYTYSPRCRVGMERTSEMDTRSRMDKCIRYNRACNNSLDNSQQIAWCNHCTDLQYLVKSGAVGNLSN